MSLTTNLSSVVLLGSAYEIIYRVPRPKQQHGEWYMIYIHIYTHVHTNVEVCIYTGNRVNYMQKKKKKVGLI